MNIVISLTSSLAPFKPFIQELPRSYLDHYAFFYHESIVSCFDKNTLKFCLMLPHASKNHSMDKKLFTYASINYLLFNSGWFKIFQRIKAKQFLNRLMQTYQDDHFNMTILAPFHLADELKLSSFIKHKSNVNLIYVHQYHLHRAQLLQTLPKNAISIVDSDQTSSSSMIKLNPLKKQLTTVSMIKHRYIFASLVHLHAKTIQMIIDAFLSMKTLDFHFYVELLDTSLMPYPYVSVDPRIHFLPSMSNKERTSYIQHAYVNLLVIDHPQPLYKVIYQDMLLQLLAQGIPLIATPIEPLMQALDQDSYWLTLLSLPIIKKAFSILIQDDYTAMLRVALSNQAYVEKNFKIHSLLEKLNQTFKNK